MAIISVLNAVKMCQNAVMGRQLRTDHEHSPMDDRRRTLSVVSYIVYIFKKYILRFCFKICLLLTTFTEIFPIGLVRPQILCSNFRSN